MKILGPSGPPELEPFKSAETFEPFVFDCLDTSTDLLIESGDDLDYMVAADYGGDSFSALYVTCPVCSHNHIVEQYAGRAGNPANLARWFEANETMDRARSRGLRREIDQTTRQDAYTRWQSSTTTRNG